MSYTSNPCVRTGAKVLDLSSMKAWHGDLYYTSESGWQLRGAPPPIGTEGSISYNFLIHGVPDIAVRTIIMTPRSEDSRWLDSQKDLTICMISSDFLDHLEEFYPILIEDGLVGSL